MAETNALREGTRDEVPPATKIAVAKAPTVLASDGNLPMAEASSLQDGTEEYVPTAIKTTVAKARTARAT